VDPEKMKKLWELYDQTPDNVAIGMGLLQEAIQVPDILQAFVVSRRTSLLRLLKCAQDKSPEFAETLKLVFNDAAFRVMAQFPLKWTAPGEHIDFDLEEFKRRGDAA
jgi:hypothetical protein